jgi:hypothetical protein
LVAAAQAMREIQKKKKADTEAKKAKQLTCRLLRADEKNHAKPESL